MARRGRRPSRYPTTGLQMLGLIVFAWLATPMAAGADGEMVVGERRLFRVGPAHSDPCDGSDARCHNTLLKYLSSYGYLRGHVASGASVTPREPESAPRAYAELRLAGASAALPGGKLAILGLSAVATQGPLDRLRLTAFETQGLLFCRDAQSGQLALPFVGMVTRHCERDAVVGVDLRVLRAEWGRDGNRTEWLSAGPAFELLANGHAQARLRRSLTLAFPLDLQSRLQGAPTTTPTTLGGGLRLRGLLRTPRWQGALMVRHRSVLWGSGRTRGGHSLEAEVDLLRNGFVGETLVLQMGLRLGGSWTSRRGVGQGLLDANQAGLGLHAGIRLGWFHAPPAI